MGYIIATIVIMLIAFAANNAEESAQESVKKSAKKSVKNNDHGCPGCGAPVISTHACSYCGREN